MDERLIPADPVVVRQWMACAALEAPSIAVHQGEIQLSPHQAEAASRLLRLLGERGGAVLADATGLGKTFVALAVARVMGPALVIAPAALRRMWQESSRRAGVVVSFQSYEALSRGSAAGGRPTLLIMDEAHHARNPRAKRYAALADLSWGAQVLLVTATPIHNRGRDLRALIALFAGSRAFTMTEDDLRHLMVRRTPESIGSGAALPTIGEPHWLPVPGDGDMLRAIKALAPAVPAADGGVAHALLQLGLIRAWSSSEAALRATLRRRLRRAAALYAALESGRLPDRRELASCAMVDDAIQLGFPELFSARDPRLDVCSIKEALDQHVAGVRDILARLDRSGGAADETRAQLLASVRERHASAPVVAFTQFADTANSVFRACQRRGGVALVTGHGARVVSGRVTVDEIVRGFDVGGAATPAASAMPLELLVATDVLSEGLSLRRAGVIVHLDLPWTVARLEQRVGRLRRIGSPHELISVYAIGPPVEARALITVVRALQRKARLSTSIAGAGELQSSLPLLGGRMARATATIVARGEANAAEELRQALQSWADGRPQQAVAGEGSVALALVGNESAHRLIAVTDKGVSERPTDVLVAVRRLSAPFRQRVVRDEFPPERVMSAIASWLDEERGRDIARMAIDAPSPAHAAVLRALQDILGAAKRSERVGLSGRVERCRRLVISARGIGAELAMARLIEPGAALDLGALERILESRHLPDAEPRASRVVGVLCLQRTDVRAFGAAGRATDGSTRQGRPQSSTPREVHDAGRG